MIFEAASPMCRFSLAFLVVGFLASFIGFVVWYGRVIVRQARAACVGSYDWWVFVDRDASRHRDGAREHMVFHGIDERDVDAIRLHRRRYRQVSLAVFLLMGLAWIGIADLVRPLCV